MPANFKLVRKKNLSSRQLRRLTAKKRDSLLNSILDIFRSKTSDSSEHKMPIDSETSKNDAENNLKILQSRNFTTSFIETPHSEDWSCEAHSQKKVEPTESMSDAYSSNQQHTTNFLSRDEILIKPSDFTEKNLQSLCTVINNRMREMIDAIEKLATVVAKYSVRIDQLTTQQQNQDQDHADVYACFNHDQQFEFQATLPLKNEDAFKDFNEKLMQPEFCQNVSVFLNCCSSNNGSDFVGDILNKIISHELGAEYSGEGRGGADGKKKKSFRETKFYLVIRKLAEKRDGNEFRLDAFHTKISNWLKARTGLRDRNKKKKQPAEDKLLTSASSKTKIESERESC